ncbi:MAG: serine hydrolase [Pseudomonadota bacterium]|nr:serine hydrolase [Pseudomonadota bacterium]
MRLIQIVALALLLQLGNFAAQADSPLTRLLEAELARLPTKSGIYIKHLGSGEEASVRADDEFESASTIKLATMVLAYQLADQNKLDLNERHVIKQADYRGGSGIFKHHDPGMNPTLRDVITQMVITSDNTATDIMIAKVGGKDRVNRFLRDSGYKVLRQNNTTLEFFRMRFAALDPRYQDLKPEDVFALMNDVPLFVEPRRALIAEIKQRSADPAAARRMSTAWDRKENWFGWATPREMGRLLEGIERGTIASKRSCDEMKRIMLAQQAGELKLRHYLTVPVAHKTGETGTVTNDVGMIYARSGTILISFFNMDLSGPRAETEDGMGRAARLVVDYFDGER